METLEGFRVHCHDLLNEAQKEGSENVWEILRGKKTKEPYNNVSVKRDN